MGGGDSKPSGYSEKYVSDMKASYEKNLAEIKSMQSNALESLERMQRGRDAEMKQQMKSLQETMSQMGKTQLMELYKEEKLHYQQVKKPFAEYYAIAAKKEEERCKLKLEAVKEGEKLSSFRQEWGDLEALRVVLYAPTGEGKSLLANRIYGDDSEWGDQGPFVPSDDVKSETQAIKKEFIPKGTRYKYGVSLTDQPGCSDSTGRDREHANNLVQYLRGLNYVNAIVLVRNFQNARLSATYQQMLANLEGMLGRRVWKNVVIVMTRVEGPQAKKAPELVKKIVDEMRNILKISTEEAPFPIVCLSNFEGYLEPLQNLINEQIPKMGEFHCDKLHSPFEELTAELDKKTREAKEAMDKFFETRHQLDELCTKIRATEDKIKSMDSQFCADFSPDHQKLKFEHESADHN